jgi:hypothetical protein
LAWNTIQSFFAPKAAVLLCVKSFFLKRKTRLETRMNTDDPLFEKVLSRDRIFDGKFLHLYRLNVRLPDGRLGEREVVAMRDAVAVLPMDAEGKASRPPAQARHRQNIARGAGRAH